MQHSIGKRGRTQSFPQENLLSLDFLPWIFLPKHFLIFFLRLSLLLLSLPLLFSPKFIFHFDTRTPFCIFFNLPIGPAGIVTPRIIEENNALTLRTMAKPRLQLGRRRRTCKLQQAGLGHQKKRRGVGCRIQNFPPSHKNTEWQSAVENLRKSKKERRHSSRLCALIMYFFIQIIKIQSIRVETWSFV